MLVTHMIPCEDGHAQERSLTDEIIDIMEANDVVVADRNFCTTRLLLGIPTRDAFFVIRHHANLTLVESGAPTTQGQDGHGPGLRAARDDRGFGRQQDAAAQDHPSTGRADTRW